MSRFLSILCLIFTFALAGQSGAEQNRISQVRVKPKSMRQQLRIASLGLEVIPNPDRTVDLFCGPDDISALQRAGIDFEIMHPDVQKFYVDRYTETADFGGFLTFNEIVTYMDEVSTLYPSIATAKFSIGQSWLGNDLWVIKISDNPNVDEDEPEVLYVTLTHSREPAGAATVMYFMDHLLANYGLDPEVTELVDNRELFFLLVHNPDGYVYNETMAPEGGGMWRKNMRDNLDGTFGVDLNRNFDCFWGFDDLGSVPWTWNDIYRGPGPFSEPENQALRDYIYTREFQVISNIHCAWNCVIWPPGHRRIWCDREEFYANLGDSLTQYNGYIPSVGWALLYVTNGSADDWMWLEDTPEKPPIVSFTTEIGSRDVDGFWPLPERIPVLCEENLFPHMYAAKIADDPFRIGPPLAPVITSPEIAAIEHTVSWCDTDASNPGATYRLLEYTGRQEYVDDVEGDYGYWMNIYMNRSTYRGHSGSTSWHTDLGNMDVHWLFGVETYEVKPDDELRMWLWYNVDEDVEYFYAQVSTDGGYEYENLPGNLTTDIDPYNVNIGNGITGESSGWVEAVFDLSDYEGQQVLFRLAYYGYAYTPEQGVYIDDIDKIELFTAGSEIDPAVPDTFYTFTGRPAGDYWYRVSATDAEGQVGRVSNYSYTQVVDLVCCATMGDVDGTDYTDGMDVVYFVDWLWAGGPGPHCMEEVDIDGDLDCGAMDLVYLVEYLWAGGPPPVGCHPL